jgi:hypothetical protein
MSLLQVPQAFGELFALEAQLYNELNAPSNVADRRVRVPVTEVTEHTISAEHSCGGFSPRRSHRLKFR